MLYSVACHLIALHNDHVYLWTFSGLQHQKHLILYKFGLKGWKIQTKQNIWKFSFGNVKLYTLGDDFD